MHAFHQARYKQPLNIKHKWIRVRERERELTDLNVWPNELISGAINPLFDTMSSGTTTPLFDFWSLGTTNPPSNTKSLVSFAFEEMFWSPTCDPTVKSKTQFLSSTLKTQYRKLTQIKNKNRNGTYQVDHVAQRE